MSSPDSLPPLPPASSIMRSAKAIIRIEAGNTIIDHSKDLPESTVPTTTRAKMTMRTTITTSDRMPLSWLTPSIFIQLGRVRP
jgi:hypothetical protein